MLEKAEKNKKLPFFLSIIMIAHNEGDVSLRTLRSLVNSAKVLDRKGISYQFLVNIDNGDDHTKKVLKDMVEQLNGRVYYTRFGDPGRARNYIVRRAKSEFIAIIDADDIVSENWLFEGLNAVINEKEPVLAHPELEVRFDEKQVCSISKRTQYDDNWHETLALIEGNRWCSVAIGGKECFVKNKYSASKKGYGYEDYYFNCLITLQGIRHVVVKNTVVFCLQKEGSISDLTHKENSVLPYNELFNLKRLQNNMKEHQLPEIKAERHNDTVEKRIEKCLFSEIEGLIAREKDLKYFNKNVLKNKYYVNDNGGDLVVGILLCRMIAGVNMRLMPRRLVFVDRIKDDLKKKHAFMTWFIVTDNDKPIEPIDGMRVLDYGMGFKKAPVLVKDVALERIIIQTRARAIMCNKLVEKWIANHPTFVQKNRIRVLEK